MCELGSGSGVFLPKSQLDTILAVSHSAEKLSRNLLRALFLERELLGCSLFGMSCNANKDEAAKPSIDAKRRDAIIRKRSA